MQSKGGTGMEFRQNGQRMEIWLTQEESADAALRDALGPVYAFCRAQKLLPVLYTSGTQELRENTAALLMQDCKRFRQQNAG